MAPNVTLHFFPANDVNGSVLHEITDEDAYFRGLTLKPERDGLGSAELLLARRVGFAGFGTGTFFPEVFVRAIVHAYSDTTYYPWGFFLTKRQQVVISKDEDGGEVFHFGGPGPKQYLDRGVLGIGSPDTGWNLDLINGVWRWTDAATVGRILGRIKNQDSTEDDPGLPDLTLSFDDDDDSASVAWADTDLSGAEDQYQIPIGTSLLQALWDLDDLIELDSWIDLGTVASPKFELNVRQGLGADKTGAAFGAGVALLREGANIVDDSLTLEGASLRKASHVIVEGANGKWAEAVRPSFSPGDYVKRDKIEYTRSQSVYWLEKAGLRWLKRQDYGEKEITVELLPGSSDAAGFYFPAPNRNLWLSNLISVDTSADGTTHTPLDLNASEDQLVTGFELSLHAAGDASSSDKRAKSWDVKAILNKQRPSQVAQTPDQKSASSGGPGPRCCSPFAPVCEEQTPDTETVLSDSTSDDADWPGTDLTTGSCWGGDHHQSMGASGGQSSAFTVAPGDTVRGIVELREQTGDDPWENVTNYSYRAVLKLEGPGMPILEFPIVSQLYHNAGCIDVTHTNQQVIPAGYTSARIRFLSRLGGWRYIASVTSVTFADPVENDPYCVEHGGSSPYTLPSDAILDLIESHTHDPGVIEDAFTNETDDTLVLAPDGAGGVEFRAEAGGGGGAPSTADYLVGTAQAGLSAEIVVGATPGGELGGTWASPTVDATHSGSAHVTAHAGLSGVTANQHHNEDHASRHLDGAADPLDVTDLDGFPGGTSTFLRGDGSFASPGGGGSGGPIGEGRPFASGAATAYVLPGREFTTVTAGTLPLSTRYYMPIIIQEQLDLVALMAECTLGAAAGREYRGGLYEATPEWQPGDLVLEGAFNLATTGVKTIAAGPTTLQPGRYLVCHESGHATPTMRIWSGPAPFASTGSANSLVSHFAVASTYGALPDPGLAWTSLVQSNVGFQARVLLQVNV